MGKILGYYLMPHPPIIVPEVGKGEEKKIEKTFKACMEIGEEVKKVAPDTVIIITPHGPMFNDAVALLAEDSIEGDLSKFRATGVEMKFKIDLELVNSIISYATEYKVAVVPANTQLLESFQRKYELDHGAIVPLYFLTKKYKQFKLVHITYGMLSDIELYKLGMAIRQSVEVGNHNVVLIASGDLSHRLKDEGPYSYSSYGKEFDEKLLGLLSNGNVTGVFELDRKLIREAGECGLRSIYIMLGSMNGYEIKGEVLSYEGTLGVGYGVMKFNITKCQRDTLRELLDLKNKKYSERVESSDTYVRLARKSIVYYFLNGKAMEVPDNLPEEMKKIKRGAFVSIKKHGELRGCIGTIYPVTSSIGEEIIKNSLAAAFDDPRFSPLRESELLDIDISVDVLTAPEKTSKKELDPKRYGVIVSMGSRRGLLLPDLEGVDTVERQLFIALRKGNISPTEDYTIERFEVMRHKEEGSYE
ncbi:hypothetical protein CPJCM30710_22380 [Clostridium polyendosporum]|uniref:AMMECR1 domain-containing protein n=1 Tax=Clostridium polyendosporum TaxID=69208 RepID=A0A919S0H8_9CLOT|nr:AmmeMemoRadiSam system protein A [Clostridium polyendosporum]GIM29572.1 hypothetical protein CPJCM30710_22380 [Clostridium polyendosporum]